jgi:flagellar protein FliO/FliZ
MACDLRHTSKVALIALALCAIAGALAAAAPTPPADMGENTRLESAGGDGTGGPSWPADTNPWWLCVQAAFWLVVVVVLIYALSYVARRVFGGSKTALDSGKLRVRVLARSHIGPRQTVSVIEVAGRLLVVGATPQTVTTLADISDTSLGEGPADGPAGSVDEAGDKTRFQAVYERCLGRLRGLGGGAGGGGKPSGANEAADFRRELDRLRSADEEREEDRGS